MSEYRLALICSVEWNSINSSLLLLRSYISDTTRIYGNKYIDSIEINSINVKLCSLVKQVSTLMNFHFNLNMNLVAEVKCSHITINHGGIVKKTSHLNQTVFTIWHTFLSFKTYVLHVYCIFFVSSDNSVSSVWV